MQKLEESLFERVDELLTAHKDRPLRTTTGTQEKVDELALRTRGLEEAIREIAMEVQKLEALKQV